MFRTMLIVLLLPALGAPTAGALEVACLFSDGMVLQREEPVPVWGTADPGATVSVTVQNTTAAATAEADGAWRATLDPLSVGGPHVLTVVSGENRIEIADVMVGEVWLCSGQSNMVWPMRASAYADLGIAAAEHPDMRLFQVAMANLDEPASDCRGGWMAATPAAVKNFSATAYYFGRTIHALTDVPIGLIQSAVGGTPSEAWTRYDTLAADASLKPLLDGWEDRLAKLDAKDEKAHAEAVAAAKVAGEDPPAKPTPSRLGQKNRPANLYNGMIAPLVPYGIRGAIWYQGESNAGRAAQYRTLFPMMISDWRDAWGEDFPFYWVQLPRFRNAATAPVMEETWPELREAQSKALELPNTGSAITIDLGEADDIHPEEKRIVGERLARLALVDVYGREDIARSGPRYKAHTIDDAGRVIIEFDYAEKLDAHNGPIQGVAIAGEDREFVWADATIDGNTLVVWSDQVPEPASVRYNWADNPPGNLRNEAGLPMAPFRTDDWPLVTAGKNF